jgi:hypothetical protein
MAIDEMPDMYKPAKMPPVKTRSHHKSTSVPQTPLAPSPLADTFMRNTVTNDIYQYSTLGHGPAIPAQLNVHTLAACGTHGFGIFEGNHGELVFIDNKVSLQKRNYLTKLSLLIITPKR